MRLIKFSISNYRSIEKIEDFTPFDTRITSFIGGNGSGKSNILKALAALKDDSKISDTDRHAKEEEELEISVTGEFQFSEEDMEILKTVGLTPNSIKGFQVKLTKTPGQAAQREFQPVGYGDGGLRNTKQRLIEAKRLYKKVNLPDEDQKQAREQFLDKFKDVESRSLEETKVLLGEFKTLIEPVKDQNPEINQKISEAEELLSFDLNKALNTVFNNLTIELLDLDTYAIEEEAPIAELKGRNTHPFLFDLLRLSGKTAEDFENAVGAMRSRIREMASRKLSSEISRIWKTHHLKFEIDRQDQNLFFGVKTLQDHSIGLKDLSDGEKWFLRFYTRLAIATKDGRRIVWLFDEPGRDLHAKSQIDLKNFFENTAESSQIIYTTHQPMMIPWHRLERIFVVENFDGSKTDERGTKIHKRFWQDEELRSPLREALALFVGEELLTGLQHVIVEGISDYFYLQGWLRYFQNISDAKIWDEQFAELARSFVSVNGIDKIPLYILFLGRETVNKVNWVVVVDYSRKFEDLKTKMSSSGLGQWTTKVKTIKELAGLSNKIDLDIEDLFEPKEYINEFKTYYQEHYQNVVLPSDTELAKLKSPIAQNLDVLLKAKNPNQVEGKPIRLDKVGIAQQVYLKLTKTRKKIFSGETEKKFKKVLKEINSLFNL